MATTPQQFVRFMFLRLDPAWRRVGVAEQVSDKEQFVETVLGFRAKMLLRTYGLSGTRGDCDLLLWQVSDDLESMQQFQTALFSTSLGGYLTIPYSYIGMMRRSMYQFPPGATKADPVAVQPQDSRFLFVYPFVKQRSWYSLPREERQAMMEEHVTIGRRHPDVRLNTIYSYGLDDQEFVLAFETDDAGDFLELVMELRESRASAYTLQDTPIFTCIQMSVWDALDSMGGGNRVMAQSTDEDSYTPVAELDELDGSRGKRVYCGRHAVALFRANDRVYAVADRCTHGRASLSEGTVDAGACVLQCPWHEGVFDLRSGEPLSGPVKVPIKVFEVKVEGGRVFVR